MSASIAGAAPQVPQWAEQTFNSGAGGVGGTYPVDCAATPNNNLALVRYANSTFNDPILAVWKLNAPFSATPLLASIGGGSLKSGNQTTLSANNPRAYQPSDRVEVTNSFGVSIGSGDSSGGSIINDETYIELTDLTSSPPALLTQIVVSSSGGAAYDYDHAGLANDLAISRDSEWAVVNSDNWIHLIYTASLPSAWTVYPFNIGDIDYSQNPPAANFNNPCSPNWAVDSVAMSNDRAIVTTARDSGPGNSFRTWVYIIDLTLSPPEIVLQHELVPPSTWTPDEYGDRPHDVAITVARNIDRVAVVTTTHGVASFDLTNNVPIGPFFFDAADSRRYQQQVDSVEVTDERAVVISDFKSAGSPQWKVEVFSVSTTSGLTWLDEFLPTGAEPPPSRAHDLAIDKDLDIAVIRTSYDNVVVFGLDSGTLSHTVVASPNGSDAYAYSQYATYMTYDVFSSDSVAICPSVIVSENPTVIQNMAITIGGYFDAASSRWVGAVDIIDLAAATLTVNQVAIVPNSNENGGCVPVDLAINAIHDEVVVRSVDPFRETSPASGPDLVGISILTSPPAITASYGGSGTIMGLDSLCVQTSGFVSTTKRILSIAQEEAAVFGADFTHRNK
jgi:hypothetical protein